MFFLKELSFAVCIINLKSALSIGGFGVSNLIKNQRLFHDNLIGTNKVKHKKYQYQEVDDDCFPVEASDFKGVIDNFASVDDQKPWEGSQRYWVNAELWGGPGYPIFAFIGGEWVESCKTLKNNSVCAFIMLYKFYLFIYFALFYYIFSIL